MQASHDCVNDTLVKHAPAIRFLHRIKPGNINEFLLMPLIGEALTVGLLKAGDIATRFMNHAHESPVHAGLSVAAETAAEILVPTAIHAVITLTMKALKQEEASENQAVIKTRHTRHHATAARKIANAVSDIKNAAFAPASPGVACA